MCPQSQKILSTNHHYGNPSTRFSVEPILAIQIKGLDFAMTALFLVLALDQILKEKSHVSSVSGLVITVVCLTLVGSTYFLLVTLLLLVVEFTILYRRRTMK